MKPKFVGSMDILRLMHKLDVSNKISKHLVGEDHTNVHKRATGIVVGTIGVIIAHSGQGLPFLLMILIDFIGYGIHAIGWIPFIRPYENEKMKPNFQTSTNPTNDNTITTDGDGIAKNP